MSLMSWFKSLFAPKPPAVPAIVAYKQEKLSAAIRKSIYYAGVGNTPIYSSLGALNTIINQTIKYQEDIVTWGVSDYWAAAQEIMSKGAGDCEDFAILKYVAGISSKLFVEYQAKFLLVQIIRTQEYHMVLAVDNWVLDNRSPNIILCTSPEFLNTYKIIGSPQP